MNSRVRTGLMIVVAGFLLVAAGILLAMRILNIGLMGSTVKPVPTPETEPKILAVFAINDITEGAVLGAQDVTLSEIPAKFAPRDIITNLGDAVGKISKVDIVEGEMILQHNLVDPTSTAYDVAYILDESHVLMALPATDLMSREAIIKRGDIVDIMVSIQEKVESINEEEVARRGPQQVTFTASQRLGVTAIVIDVIRNENKQENNTGEPKRNQIEVQAYLIALDPQEALVLKFLKDKGGLFEFVIRAPTSNKQFDLTPVTSEFIKELYGLDLLP